jgi:hypothetical protein
VKDVEREPREAERWRSNVGGRADGVGEIHE